MAKITDKDIFSVLDSGELFALGLDSIRLHDPAFGKAVMRVLSRLVNNIRGGISAEAAG